MAKKLTSQQKNLQLINRNRKTMGAAAVEAYTKRHQAKLEEWADFFSNICTVDAAPGKKAELKATAMMFMTDIAAYGFIAGAKAANKANRSRTKQATAAHRKGTADRHKAIAADYRKRSHLDRPQRLQATATAMRCSVATVRRAVG